MITLPFPPSVNRYWRMVHGHMVLSADARLYKNAVGMMLNCAGLAPVAGPVTLRIDVYRPQKRGDLDNVLKGLLDALKGYAYHDDAQVVEIHARRFDDKDNPRVEVCIE